ncbi:ADP-ribosyl-(dinitrogen reductase) hydrolase [Chimaeribacter californicus]|uniref:ADP-ribosyl-(Dinitrogen reductase) hydrolase n=1 Tax=Chimaeribacter californicus TaxID=2060067 RepID=A0A2N5DZ63_9GAMM|nr:ADP-ribosyl-(dinitrogen reductase) hydrolase [Chimaeribacter californicus]PLR33020.1 ADP-ribosyl-(dinitrogen reductase) hydrolase [Chimaeribacter californicus]
MQIKIHPGILEKLLQKHGVSEKEVHECFLNRDGHYLKDTREKNQTLPPTLWFIAETNSGRKLKICFVPRGPGNPSGPVLKTAYEPNRVEEDIYQKHGY